MYFEEPFNSPYSQWCVDKNSQIVDIHILAVVGLLPPIVRMTDAYRMNCSLPTVHLSLMLVLVPQFFSLFPF